MSHAIRPPANHSALCTKHKTWPRRVSYTREEINEQKNNRKSTAARDRHHMTNTKTAQSTKTLSNTHTQIPHNTGVWYRKITENNKKTRHDDDPSSIIKSPSVSKDQMKPDTFPHLLVLALEADQLA